jgi:hypothetical protein
MKALTFSGKLYFPVTKLSYERIRHLEADARDAFQKPMRVTDHKKNDVYVTTGSEDHAALLGFAAKNDDLRFYFDPRGNSKATYTNPHIHTAFKLLDHASQRTAEITENLTSPYLVEIGSKPYKTPFKKPGIWK